MTRFLRNALVSSLFFALVTAPLAAGTIPPSQAYMVLGWTYAIPPLPPKTEIGEISMIRSFDPKPTDPTNPIARITASVETKAAPPTVEVFNTVEYSASGVEGQLRYYFELQAPVGIYPDDFKVPVIFASKAHVVADPLTTAGESEGASVLAAVSLAIGYRTPTQGDVSLGAADNLHALADDSVVQDAKTFFHVHHYTPFGLGWAQLTAITSISRNGQSVIDGSAYAYIDPNIYVDPNFMVEYQGRTVPANQVFQLVFSEGIVNIPEPATASLVALAALLLGARPHRF